MNIAGEKKTETLERANGMPVRRFPVIIAKILPCWMAGYIVLTVVLTLAALLYGITPVGSLTTLFLYATVYVLVISGMGTVIANYSATIQHALAVTVFCMLIMIVMSGAFFSVPSMPQWVQVITQFNPLYHFVEVIKSVYLKGGGIANLFMQFFVLSGFAVFFTGWAVLSYRKGSKQTSLF
jgi:ABC-2 type transport system permease protein